MNSITQIRARLGVTQAVMADALGVTQGNVSNYERGQTVPPDVAKLLIAYSRSLGFDITYDDIYEPVAKKVKSRRASDPPADPGRPGRNPPNSDLLMSMSSRARGK